MMVYIANVIVVMLMVYYHNKKNDTKYNPITYGIDAFLFGTIFGLFMFYGRRYKDIGEEEKSNGCYRIAIMIAVINIIEALWIIF